MQNLCWKIQTINLLCQCYRLIYWPLFGERGNYCRKTLSSQLGPLTSVFCKIRCLRSTYLHRNVSAKLIQQRKEIILTGTIPRSSYEMFQKNWYLRKDENWGPLAVLVGLITKISTFMVVVFDISPLILMFSWVWIQIGLGRIWKQVRQAKLNLNRLEAKQSHNMGERSAY